MIPGWIPVNQRDQPFLGRIPVSSQTLGRITVRAPGWVVRVPWVKSRYGFLVTMAHDSQGEIQELVLSLVLVLVVPGSNPGSTICPMRQVLRWVRGNSAGMVQGTGFAAAHRVDSRLPARSGARGTFHYAAGLAVTRASTQDSHGS